MQAGLRRRKQNSFEVVTGTMPLKNKKHIEHKLATTLKPFAQRCSPSRDILNDTHLTQSETRSNLIENKKTVQAPTTKIVFI